jgi:hypothetical protein
MVGLAAGIGLGKTGMSADASKTVVSARTVPILRLADVRPGMRGRGLTVLSGTKPEWFAVRVVAIMRNFLPRQDVILIQADDPRIAFTGIAAGMSGSPVYIDGKLMGALAYAWNFSKEPLAGVTPIEAMLEEGRRPRRLVPLQAAASPGGPDRVTIAEGGDSVRAAPSGAALGAAEGTPSPRGETLPLPGDGGPWRSAAAFGGGSDLRPVSLALTVSGAPGHVLDDFAEALAAVGLGAVVHGGGGGAGAGSGPAKGPPRLLPAGRPEPGSALAVELIRGDMSAVATGTVTYVDGDQVLAFGHPMMDAGEMYVPLVDAEIHAIVPSLSQSMKLASPLREVGALVQDRQACIVGDLGLRASMVPVRVRVTAPQSPPRLFTAEVARNRRLTPLLAGLVATTAVTDAEPTATDVMLAIRATLAVRGLPPIVLDDQVFSSDGASKPIVLLSRGLRAIQELLFNPFEPIVVDGIDLSVDIALGHEVSEIVGVSSPGGRIRPGDTIPLRVALRPYAGGAEVIDTIPVVIPADAVDQPVRIEVAAGAIARPDLAAPESLRDAVENLKKAFPPRSIVVAVARQDDGIALRGRLLPSLPGSAFDTLRPSSQTRRGEPYRVSDRFVHATRDLIVGKQEISIWVGDQATVDDALPAATAAPR